MKNVLLVSLLFFSFSVLAGGNHFHPKKIASCKSECTESEVKEVSKQALFELADMRLIPTSWTSIPLEKVEKKTFSKGPEWVLSFFDKSQPATKQRLYVFITMNGWLNGRNYSGK